MQEPRSTPLADEDEILTELGIWLSGLESFLNTGHHSFIDQRNEKYPLDTSKEFRLVHSTFQRCAMLNAWLLSGNGSNGKTDVSLTLDIKFSELDELSSALRDLTLLSNGIIGSNSLGSGEWKAWCRMVSMRLRSVPVFSKLIKHAEVEGEKFLPGVLRDLAQTKGALSIELAELAMILPRFARVLRWLAVVGKMLEADQPLKPALLIFSRVNEQITELCGYINNRLERFPDEEAELFGSLDAASYTASVELKKVYAQELAGIAKMRPSPSIYARMETAYALLSEGFQQILAGFAKSVDPAADVFKLFPNFNIKLEQSIRLRSELAAVVQVVKSAETKPDKREIETMHKMLREFMKGTVRFLFYKDTETVERFVEEILVTKQNKDLVPILHRFGAFLETLFGQVNLRAVLDKQPFEQN